MSWTDALIRAGAPVLKSVVEQQIGGVGGKIAGAAIDSLAEALGTEATGEAIAEKIDADPSSAVVVQRVEQQFVQDMARIAEANRDAMVSYHQVLMLDANQEGILSKLWRPLFAIVFTVMFGMVGVTICWLMWTRQLGTLQQLGEVTTFLTFMFIAGCAVLGVQIYQRSEEKKAGVS
ncbi:hypothetical protein VW35_00750 [Devosia soli]|uniref:Holin of 3TMs, for gene-transfer release n=1 Tax=Devosia soli TaxID=361041 RepID=A0A0F5LF01_9HYPH|nr:hypothetical protein [Devosia soli]KKB80774.1 hypothetical protein VW35_00750 [Devosia soli]